MTLSVDWYFDFVSPYSYICLHRLGELPVQVSYKPVLFAGLLNHWGQKGPAEIPAKRKWTYRWCTWWARELGIPHGAQVIRSEVWVPMRYNPQRWMYTTSAGAARKAMR